MNRGCSNRKVIAILSYNVWLHPRSIKIAKTLTRYGYKVKLWGARAVRKRWDSIISTLLEYLVALIDVALLKADLYWIENIPDIIYLPIALLGKKYIYDRRSPWAKEALVMHKLPKYVFKLMELIERYMIKKSSYFVAVSTGLVKEFEHIAKRSIVIPNYPERSFVSNISREEIRRKLNVSPDRKVVIYVGKLSRVEGTDLLPSVVESIKGLNAELWIVGDGPARNIIQELVSKYPNYVKWFGWVSYGEVPKYIVAADIGLVPRHKTPYRVYYSHEGIHKITEYFAYGKPVIACGIAPSPYYLVVEPEELGEAVAKAVKGEVRLPKPPKLFWEDHSLPLIVKVVNELLK